MCVIILLAVKFKVRDVRVIQAKHVWMKDNKCTSLLLFQQIWVITSSMVCRLLHILLELLNRLCLTVKNLLDCRSVLVRKTLILVYVAYCYKAKATFVITQNHIRNKVYSNKLIERKIETTGWEVIAWSLAPRFIVAHGALIAERV